MRSRLFSLLLLAVLLALRWPATAEDIDLFAEPKASATDTPHALFVIDNAGSFNADASGTSCVIDGVATALSGKVSGIEQCALYAAISALDVTKVNIGIGVMVYNANQGVRTYTGASCPGGTGEGGCLVYPIQTLTATTKAALLAWIKTWNTGNGAGAIQANNEKMGASMQEAWSYYAGRQGLSGADYSGIKPEVGCSKNFTIFIGNAFGNNGSPGDSTGKPRSALEGVTSKDVTSSMIASPLPSSTDILTPTTSNYRTMCGAASTSSSSVPGDKSTHESKGFYGDEWARYMAGRNIVTYSIGILDPSSCKPEYAWELQSMASVGGGKYFPTTNLSGLTLAIKTALSEVQSVNSAFAAVSLPVSVNTQGTYLNQVFIGMFRPDPNSLPRWFGNLKQYKMGYQGTTFQLLDADGNSAISSSGTDFIAECGRSYWTPALTAPDDYWSLLVNPNCSGYAASSNTPDGNMVEKGGQGYTLRAGSPTTRIVKTCALGASCTLADFNTSNAAITPALLGVSTTSDKDTLVNWTRGMNVQLEAGRLNGATLTSTQMRPSVHGDVVHSRPVAINFGTDAAPQVVVFYGANDGMLRAINGNRSASIGSVTAGGELWAFMPPEFYAKINRLYQNTQTISSPNVSGTPKDYGMDGSVTAYVIGANDVTTSGDSAGDAWVYAGMRRGGRALYAFKVNHLNPASISLKWKIGCQDSGSTHCYAADGSTAFTGIGQTWTIPKVFRASGYGSGKAPLLVMGGGYDATCEDASSYTCTSTTGNHVYVIDADTGQLLKDFTTLRGVTGDVLMLQDSSGMATYGYASDLGGNLYRISGSTANSPIGTTPPASWTLTQIASLGCSVPGSCTSPPNRKFIFGPDVVVEGGYNILLIGSGDREKPVNYTNPVQNYFFMLKDKPESATWLTDEGVAGRCGVGNNLLCLASLAAPVSAGTCAAPTAQNKGWMLQLQAKEQVVTAAVTVTGTVYFSTHQPVAPSTESCTANLGRSRAYAISYVNAASPQGCKPDGSTDSPFVQLAAGGLPPSPVAGKVKLDDGTIVPFVIGAKGPLQSTAVKAPGSNPSGTKIRSYWYIQK